MAYRKVRKDIWEKIFEFPSFNIRFSYTLALVLFVFLLLGQILFFKFKIVSSTSDIIALLNLLVQFATLVLGVFATYYALRQLVETRFNSLDESGLSELRNLHYNRAFEKWREAFYIKPDASVFTNMCESLVLLGDFGQFDYYVRMSEKSNFREKGILSEPYDQIAFEYLQVARNLLEENQGEAKKRIKTIVELVGENKLMGFSWDFRDIQNSFSYQTLEGDCRTIFDNLISYLSKTIPLELKGAFEAGRYAVTVENSLANEIPSQ